MRTTRRKRPGLVVRAGASCDRAGMEDHAIADDGTTLHVEWTGTGPVVLLLQGGISEASATTRLAAELADTFTVVSYDRRGLGRSPAPVPGEPPPDALHRHALDAAAVLRRFTDRPASVVGASIGAVVALQLAVEEPDLVGTAVVHEPPLPAVVHDAEREAGLDHVAELARTDVVAAIGAMGRLVADRSDPEPGAGAPRPAGDLHAGLRWFFAHDFPAVRANPLDAARIRSVPVTLVPSVGADVPGGWDRRCAEALAAALGRPAVPMPGGHGALTTRPRGAARQLRRILTP